MGTGFRAGVGFHGQDRAELSATQPPSTACVPLDRQSVTVANW